MKRQECELYSCCKQRLNRDEMRNVEKNCSCTKHNEIPSAARGCGSAPCFLNVPDANLSRAPAKIRQRDWLSLRPETAGSRYVVPLSGRNDRAIADDLQESREIASRDNLVIADDCPLPHPPTLLSAAAKSLVVRSGPSVLSFVLSRSVASYNAARESNLIPVTRRRLAIRTAAVRFPVQLQRNCCSVAAASENPAAATARETHARD